MERRFGIELELTGLNTQQATRALQAINIPVGSGSWSVKLDGSVSGGCEVVSPVLQGASGIEQVRQVAAALGDAGGNVDRRCGFHVHFDAADLTVGHIRNIVTRYAAHESRIDAIMAPSRRGNGNTYCHSVIELAGRSEFRNATTIQQLTQAQHGRYFKVNLQAYHRHGTVEFRQHAGTLNADKVVNWVLFLGHFVAACHPDQASSPAQLAAAPAVRVSHNSPAQARLLEVLRGQNWVSRASLEERFNWQAHTVRAAISRLRDAGHVIHADNRPGQSGYLYVGEAGQERIPRRQRPAALATPADDLFAGIPAHLVTFYRNRAAVLALAA